jgi:hypothetical protein
VSADLHFVLDLDDHAVAGDLQRTAIVPPRPAHDLLLRDTEQPMR